MLEVSLTHSKCSKNELFRKDEKLFVDTKDDAL